MNPRGRNLARAALAALATLMALLSAEAFLRWRLPTPPEVPGREIPDGLLHDCVVTDPSRGWAFRPGACGRDVHGLLRLPSRDADEASWTLLLEGDSVGENPWTHALPDALAAQLGRPVTVLNGAMSGYNTCQEAEALRAHLAGVRVDAVLVQTCVNDLGGSVTLLPAGAGWSQVWTGGRWRTFPTALLRLRMGQLGLAHLVAGADETATRRGERRGAGDARLTPELATRCAEDIASQTERASLPLAVLHAPALVDPQEPDARLANLRAQEADMLRAWATVRAPQINGRAVLTPLGDLAALASSEDDRLHPSPRASGTLARAVAVPLAAAFTTR